MKTYKRMVRLLTNNPKSQIGKLLLNNGNWNEGELLHLLGSLLNESKANSDFSKWNVDLYRKLAFNIIRMNKFPLGYKLSALWDFKLWAELNYELYQGGMSFESKVDFILEKPNDCKEFLLEFPEWTTGHNIDFLVDKGIQLYFNANDIAWITLVIQNPKLKLNHYKQILWFVKNKVIEEESRDSLYLSFLDNPLCPMDILDELPTEYEMEESQSFYNVKMAGHAHCPDRVFDILKYSEDERVKKAIDGNIRWKGGASEALRILNSFKDNKD